MQIFLALSRLFREKNIVILFQKFLIFANITYRVYDLCLLNVNCGNVNFFNNVIFGPTQTHTDTLTY